VLPNAIIAGTNKAGTTSLFRYLASHPGVCASRVKETRFFSRHTAPDFQAAHEFYAQQFSHCDASLIRLEASPDYLLHAQTVAPAMATILPDARLIFMVRDPVGRLFSAFRRRKSRDDASLAHLSLDTFVQLLLSGDTKAIDSLPIDVQPVDYARQLAVFLHHFPKEQIAVRFFDSLHSDSQGLVTDLCRFLELNPDFFSDYEFAIENQTRNVRSPLLHKLAYHSNRRLEPAFNRFPALRGTVRKLYSGFNYQQRDSASSGTEHAGRLTAHLQGQTTALHDLLQEQYPGLALPAWLLEHKTAATT